MLPRRNPSPLLHACRPRNTALRRHFFRALFIWMAIVSGVVHYQPAALGLTSEERSELARKFKYYHRTVRPVLELNLLDTLNGTFFRLVTELEVQATFQSPEGIPAHGLSVDFALFVHYRDDRLLLRDLEGPMTIPDEFQPWMPRIQPQPMELAHGLLVQKSATFEPKTGHLTAIFRFFGTIRCQFEPWKMPFEQYKCHFWLETDPDERLELATLRDFRPAWQIHRIEIGTELWPFLMISFKFKSRRWHHILVSAYAPSFLLFSCALLAQWRRRKIQVIVTMGALLAILILFHHHSHSVPPLKSSTTLLDLWLGGVFIHLVCLLCVDLALPARRVTVFKKSASSSSSVRRGLYSLPPTQNGRAMSCSQPLYTTPHYVSSTHLQHCSHGGVGTPRPTLRRQRHEMPSPGHLIRTHSVPPHRRLAQVTRTAAERRLPVAAHSEPLQRKMTTMAQPPPPVPSPAALPRADSGEQQRTHRIAALLAEMENIRREAEEDIEPPLRHADSVVGVDDQQLTMTMMMTTTSSEEVLIKSSSSSFATGHQQQQQQQPLMTTTTTAKPTKNNCCTAGSVGDGTLNASSALLRRAPFCLTTAGGGGQNGFSVAGADRRHSATSDSSELGRAEGIPRRKRLMLGFVALSFSFFVTSYVTLVALLVLELIDIKSD